jgi:hypothetical protein
VRGFSWGCAGGRVPEKGGDAGPGDGGLAGGDYVSVCVDGWVGVGGVGGRKVLWLGGGGGGV